MSLDLFLVEVKTIMYLKANAVSLFSLPPQCQFELPPCIGDTDLQPYLYLLQWEL